MDTDIAEKGQPLERMATVRQKGSPRSEILFFEMSRPVESPEMLRSWVEWFQRLHIPCAIARTQEGYTLWRKGREAGRRRSKIPSVNAKFIYLSGLTPRELIRLKEIDRDQDHEGCSQPSEGFEDLPASPYEEPQEGLTPDASALFVPVARSKQNKRLL